MKHRILIDRSIMKLVKVWSDPGGNGLSGLLREALASFTLEKIPILTNMVTDRP